MSGCPRGSPGAVSAVIPTWNRAGTIAGAVASCREQTVAVHEIVVVDDGSTDGTAELLARLDGPLRVIRQDNRGVAAARDGGARAAAGPWLLFVDSDDALAPDAVERGLAQAARTGACAVVFSGRETGPAGERILSKPTPGDLYSLEGLLGDDVDFAPCWGLMHRSCYLDAGGFDHRLRQCEDWDLLLRFVAGGHRAAILREPVYIYRAGHEGRLTGEVAGRARVFLSILERIARDDPATARRCRRALRGTRSRFQRILARDAARRIGEDPAALAEARRALAAAWRDRPLHLRTLRDLLWARLAPRSFAGHYRR
ncbi:MAG: hypothetical protein Kow0062_14960 [Acidobacteriota bacterium]